MSEKIKVTPDVMRQVADRHDEVAEGILTAKSLSAEIQAAVSTHGAIMYQVKAAVADVLGSRDATLSAEAETHRHLADALRREAKNFIVADEHNAERLRLD